MIEVRLHADRIREHRIERGIQPSEVRQRADCGVEMCTIRKTAIGASKTVKVSPYPTYPSHGSSQYKFLKCD
jgi:hypothetical protein